MLPPKEEWGKVVIKDSFSYSKYWWLGIGPVNYVSNRPEHHGNLINEKVAKKEERNELLYAMKYAPYVCPGVKPDGLLEKVAEGKIRLNKYNNVSVKMEANKFPPDSRDIHAADNVTRVLTSFYDWQAIPVSNRYSGIMARKSEQSVDKVFDNIGNKTSASRKNGNDVVCVSIDVKGWRPNGDREG